MTHYFTWNNPRAVVLCTLLLLSMLAFFPSSASAQDFTITTTADFDAGTKSVSENNTDIETITDNPGMTANQIEVVNAMGDAFETPSQYANSRKWRPEYRVGTTGGTAHISMNETGKLETNISGVSASTEYGVTSRFAISGDFSIQIELEADNLPSVANGVLGIIMTETVVGMAYDNTKRIQMLRRYVGAHQIETALINGGVVDEQIYVTTATEMTFMLNRSGTTFTALYDIGSGWVQLMSAATSIGDLRMRVYASSSIGYADIIGHWDNFIVNSGTLVASYPNPGESFIRDSNNPLTITMPGGATGVVHPDVLYFPSGEDGYKFWMYYTPIPAAYEEAWLVRSNDGITWTDSGISNPVVSQGGSGDWDENMVADPDVCIVSGTWYLYYAGQNITGGGLNGQIGLATSSDGKTYTKSAANPVINQTDFETETGVSVDHVRAPSCYYDNGASQFHLIFDSDDSSAIYNFQIWAANSTDGETFTIKTTQVLTYTGDGSCDDKGVAHPDISYYDGNYHLYYMGHDNTRYRKALATSTSINSSYTRSDYNPVIDIDPASDWENDDIYRSSPVTDTNGNVTLIDGEFWMYYSAFYGVTTSYPKIGLAKTVVGVWESDAQTMTSGNYLESLTITHVVATGYYITEVYVEVAGVEKARWSTDITSGSSTTLRQSSLTSGNLANINADFTIIIEMISNATATPTVTQIEGTYVAVSSGKGQYDCDFQPTIDAYNVSFQASCNRDDALIFHWIWDFGDGTTFYDDDSAIEHQYSQAGSYNVSLEVIDYDGRTALVSKTITIGEGDSTSSFFWSAMGTFCWLWGAIILTVILAALVRQRRKKEGASE